MHPLRLAILMVLLSIGIGELFQNREGGNAYSGLFQDQSWPSANVRAAVLPSPTTVLSF